MDLHANAFQRARDVLEQIGEPELLDAYSQYAAYLEAILGRGWLDTYAAMYQRDRRQLTGQTAGLLVLPEEAAVRDRVIADPEVARLYQKFIVLLARHRLLDERYET